MAKSIEMSAGFMACYFIIKQINIKAGVYAAIVRQMVSFKIGFKCNIYVHNPFLIHTESITH